MTRIFNEIEYGKLKKVDLHGLTREEAWSEVIHQLNIIDNNFNGIEFVHGYRGGQVLKNFLRNEFEDKRVLQKINFDASTTLYLIKK